MDTTIKLNSDETESLTDVPVTKEVNDFNDDDFLSDEKTRKPKGKKIKKMRTTFDR
jgi:hypothetical protein